MSKGVKRRRNRRNKARAICLELLERGTFTAEEINAELTRRHVKSSKQYVGVIMGRLLDHGLIERGRTSDGKAFYRMVPSKEYE